MATKTNHRIASLKKEVELLRSLIIGVLGKDKEGEYQPKFVKKILGAVREKTPYSFKDEKSFLSHLSKNS